MLYKLLATRNEEHDLALIEKIRLLYEGGYAVNKKASKLLVKAPNESQEYYEYRCKQAAYLPYLGQLIDYLVGALFQSELAIVPAGDAEDPNTLGEVPDKDFYPEFATDADRKDTPFTRIVRDAVTEALICKCAWVQIDMPPAVEAESLKDEDELGGSRAYCFPVPYEQIYDWCEDDEGELLWAITGKRIQDRKSPEANRDTYVDRFRVWRLNETVSEETSRVTWEDYQTEPVKVGTEPKPDADVPLVKRGNTTFEYIPLERLPLPAGLWAGNKVGPLSEEHFRRRSDLIGAMARSLVEIPVVSLGPEMPEVGGAISQSAEDPHRGDDPIGKFRSKGYMVLDGNSKLQFVGPTGAAYDIVDKQLHDLRDEIFRSVHAMALSLANTGAAVGRSGESKAEDRSATEIVLGYLGALAREFGIKIYRCVSEARGEDVTWVAHGLDSFDIEDRADLIDEAVQLETVEIPSLTWKKEHKKQLAFATTRGASPETKAQIGKEIDDGMEEAVEVAAAMKEAALKAAQNPPPEDDDENPKAPGGVKPPQFSPPAKRVPPPGG